MWQSKNNGNQVKSAEVLSCCYWDFCFLFSSAALPWPMPGEKSVIWSHLIPGISRYHICRVCSLEVNIPLQKAGLGILEESCCTQVIFTPNEICNLETKAKEHGNHDNDFKMPNKFPLWHFSSGSLARSKHRSNTEKFTVKWKWTNPSQICSVFKIRHPTKNLLFPSMS